MGTPLTGSTVASTYTGLLKTSDNAAITSTLKSLGDGGGNDSALQVSNSAVNTTGDFSVATSKFTVAASSGNASVTGALGVTGAATVGSLATAGNIATSAGTISSYGAISQTQAAQNNSLAGNLAVGGNLSVTGATTLSGNLSVPGTLSCTGDFAVNTNKFNVTAASGNTAIAGTLGVAGDLAVANNKFNVTAASGNTSVAGTLGVTGATSLSTLGVSGAATLSSTLDVTGTATLNGNLVANANTTIGDASGDSLTINANNVTLPNASTVTVDLANDKVLITDASDSSKVRVVAASALGINATNAPQIVQTVGNDRITFTGATTGPGTEISTVTTTITPRSSSSKVLVSIVLNYSCLTNASQYVLFRITRNGTQVGNSIGTGQQGIASGSYEDGEVNAINNTKIEFLDSPSTGSAVTYKVHIYSPLSPTNVYMNYAVNGGTSFTTCSMMTLQEFFA
jgi:fibronectin-binding autotransporter adhesin